MNSSKVRSSKSFFASLMPKHLKESSVACVPEAPKEKPKRFYEDQFCSEGFAVTKNCAAARFWTSNLFARLIVTAGF